MIVNKSDKNGKKNKFRPHNFSVKNLSFFFKHNRLHWFEKWKLIAKNDPEFD